MPDQLMTLAQLELNKLEEELIEIQAARKSMEQREARITKRLAALRVIVEPEDAAVIEAAEVGIQQPDVNAPAPAANGNSQTTPRQEEDQEDSEYGTKIDAVRKLFGNSPRGFTPTTLWQAASAAQITDRRGYIYTTIQKLHKNQEIVRRRGGRYVATEKLLQAVREEEPANEHFTLQ